MRLRIGLAVIPAIMCLTGCLTIGKVIKSYGFREFRPPKQNLTPGTVVYLTRKNPYEGGTVCTAADSVGPDLPIQQSPSKASEIQNRTSVGVSLGGSYLKKIKGDARYNSVKDVSVVFSNVNVLETTDTDVLRGLERMNKFCRDAIKVRPEAVTIITQSLEADVAYHVDFSSSSGLSVEAEKELMEGLAAKLNGTVDTKQRGKITGTKLMWGIVGSPHLIAGSGAALLNEIQEKIGKLKH